MKKFLELKAMADSIGLTIELDKTNDKEIYKVIQDGVEIARGSYEIVKAKLEDLMDMKNLESKIEALIKEGKSDNEIIKILSDYPPSEGEPMPEDVINHIEGEIMNASNQITVLINEKFDLDITDVEEDKLAKMLKATIEQWYTEIMSESDKYQ